MTEICLVRHGETDWNLEKRTQGITDIPLNQTGRDQALATAEMLRSEPWDAVYSSPLKRAHETAQVIAAHLGIEAIHLRRGLQERHFGDAEGILASERKERFGNGMDIPGAETWDEVLHRGLVVLRTIVRDHPGDRVVVVSHGGTIMNLLGSLSDGEVVPGEVALANASANLLVWDERWQLKWYNRTADTMLPLDR